MTSRGFVRLLHCNKTAAAQPRVAAIVIDDDEEEGLGSSNGDSSDVFVYSPASAPQFQPRVRSRGQAHASSSPKHEDLDLRLGRSGTRPTPCTRLKPFIQRSVASRITVDLTNASAEKRFVTESAEKRRQYGGKRKQQQELSPKPMKELKLVCAICMDTMKDETTTVCGHIFCKICITEALQVHKSCPTCRKKLAKSQIHRIYL